jgi:hypothetical protein
MVYTEFISWPGAILTKLWRIPGLQAITQNDSLLAANFRFCFVEWVAPEPIGRFSLTATNWHRCSMPSLPCKGISSWMCS